MTTGSMFPGNFSPIPGSFQAITVNNTVPQALTVGAGVGGNAKYAIMQVLGANVNWRDDGTDPTAAVGGGMFVNAGDDPVGFAGNLFTSLFISTAPGGSTILVSYYY